MKNMNTRLIALICSVLPLCAFSQADRRAKIIFVNAGSMNVAQNPAGVNLTTLYIAGAAAATDSSNILQNGITEITGDLFHGADTHIFNTDTNGNGQSTGTFKFSGLTNGSVRYLAALNDNISFDRTNKYITFPQILINTNDEILLSSRLGADAISISRNPGYKGKLVLKSETLLSGTSRKVYDASLRIIGAGGSNALVAPGTVAVERDATAYIDSIGGGTNTPLFGFATPFNATQIAAYFASNWIRQTISGINDNIIATLGEGQFITNASAALNPGNAYFVRLRDKTANYNVLLNSGIVPTVEGQDLNTTKTKFAFNGKVYDFSSIAEQLFAEGNIYRSISNPTNTTNNWVIGNSYTAPISIYKLGAALSTSSNVKFDGNIYVLPYGSTTYQAYNYLAGENDPSNPDLTEIPATSVFLLKTASNSPAGTFNISKELLTHGTTPHNTPLRAKSALKNSTGNFYDYVSFTARLASNANIYDRTAIAVYDEASFNKDDFDAQKIEPDVFGIYTLSADKIALATNKIPSETQPTEMAFKVKTVKTDFKLEVSTLGIVNGQGLWLRDKQTNTIRQMHQGDTYNFTADPGDEHNRFTVYFLNPEATTQIDNQAIPSILAININGTLHINHLNQIDKQSQISVFDLQGRCLIRDAVQKTPAQQLNINQLLPGVYILKIEGKRNHTSRFIK
jgi:hypothetical protein